MESDVNRSIEEQLSAFLDGELRDEELELLVRRLERNQQYRATLARYSLIGNVVRNDPAQTYPERFRAGIMAAIAAENSPRAPAEVRRQSGNSWRMPFVSAAAVLLLVLGLSTGGLLNKVPGAASLPPNTQTLAKEASPVLSLANVVEPAAIPRQRRAQAALNPDRLTSYMVSHREYSQPLHGPIANSRIVVQQVRFEE